MCKGDFTNPDCAFRTCPLGKASDDTTAECSNHGFCKRESGHCECFRGFYGANCELFSCPKDTNGDICSGFGTCDEITETCECTVDGDGI